MKTIRFLLFVISYGMVLNQAYSYQLETIADETYSKYHNSINQILPDMKVTQNMIFKGDPRIQFSNKHSKVKRSLLKRPLRPTPNAADSSACRSCYSRRKGCLLTTAASVAFCSLTGFIIPDVTFSLFGRPILGGKKLTSRTVCTLITAPRSIHCILDRLYCYKIHSCGILPNSLGSR